VRDHEHAWMETLRGVRSLSGAGGRRRRARGWGWLLGNVSLDPSPPSPRVPPCPDGRTSVPVPVMDYFQTHRSLRAENWRGYNFGALSLLNNLTGSHPSWGVASDPSAAYVGMDQGGMGDGGGGGE
jgi:hypothetical protein